MKIENNNHSDFTIKMLKGLELANKRMMEDKIAKNQSVVIMHKGKVVTVKAADVCNLK